MNTGTVSVSVGKMLRIRSDAAFDEHLQFNRRVVAIFMDSSAQLEVSFRGTLTRIKCVNKQMADALYLQYEPLMYL
jgi:hypothetical protein